MKIHFIGIGGRGMSRLAELALQMGYEVSGSDRVDKSVLQTLSSQGANIYRAHSISNIQGVDLVIYSAGIAESNVEIIAAKNECIPVFSRSQGLAKLLRQNKQEVITVAGTYGKTTTTTLLATLLDFAGLDPTIYVGGKASSLIGGGTKLGHGKYAVVEADEYLGEFYHLDSAGSIITGIESNHLDYYRNIENLCRSFERFIELNKFSSRVTLADGDSPLVNTYLVSRFEKDIVTYGLHSGTWHAQDISLTANGEMQFAVYMKEAFLATFSIHGVGTHLIKNALGAIAMAYHLDVGSDLIRGGLLRYRDPERHFEKKYEGSWLTIIDDNARIPIQVEAAIEAGKWAYPDSELFVVGGFWGHLNSRELDQYSTCLSKADYAFILPVGDASEQSGGAEKIDADKQLAEKIQHYGGRAYTLEDYMQIAKEVLRLRKEGKKVVVMTLGYDSFSPEFDQITSIILRESQTM